MYLGCSFLYNDFKLIKTVSKGGPDLCIKFDKTKIWIEAVTPKMGNGPDKLERPPYMVVVKVPLDKMILRIQNSIDEKKRKYKSWMNKDFIKGNEPFILAINGSEIPFARTERELPLILRSISQFGDQFFTFNKENFEVIDQGYHYEVSVQKVSGKTIQKDLLSNEEFSFISAFLYSCIDPLNIPNNMGDDYIFIHNPLARNKLLIGFLKLGREFYRKENKLKMNDYRIEKVK